jgi:hypothetical protein
MNNETMISVIPKLTPEMAREIKKLYTCGFTYMQISERLGIDFYTLQEWVFRPKLPDEEFFSREMAKCNISHANACADRMVHIATEAAEGKTPDVQGAALLCRVMEKRASAFDGARFGTKSTVVTQVENPDEARRVRAVEKVLESAPLEDLRAAKRLFDKMNQKQEELK